MDILKRSLAPITEMAWNEIDEQARRILHPLLSARRVVEVDGPRGWDYASVPLGRLEVPKKQPVKGIEYGVHQVLPLAEARAFFNLNIWELDNMVRGSRDIDLSPLETAAKNMAKFEESAVYNGFDPGCVVGMKKSSPYPALTFSGGAEQILETVSKGIATFLKASVEGPYSLVVSVNLWSYLTSYTKGYPLEQHLEKLLGGAVVLNTFMNDSYLLSVRGGDLKLVLGQDLSIGYHSHDTESVRLYFTETFTFQILDPSVILRIEWKK